MTNEIPSEGESLPLAVLERIDRACLRFEAVWQRGEVPQVEDYLGDTHGFERSRLLRELLLLELDYRSRHNEQPTPDEYQARFPQDSKLVSDVFEELSTGGALAKTVAARPRPALRQPGPPSHFGDYELLEVLGEGGMGVVYRARQRTPDRLVALKIIRPDRLAAVLPDDRDKAIERFRAEVQAAARLEHDNIVPVYDAGEVDGQPFLAMRYVEGRGLDEVLRNGPVDGRAAAALLEPVAQAVHYAHGRDVIHRDIKPRNILLDTHERPYVADFGLAKSFAAAQELTRTQEVLGTPAYMSPEQARGPAGVDHRTDVYSLGATLYELLTGRPPFRAATPAETQRQVIENEPVPPRQLNPAVDRDLETICLKCLEKEPGRRYDTAEALADEFVRYQQGKPIHARPITRLARAWRWCKRNRIAASLAAVAAVLLLVLSTGGPAVAVWRDALLRDKESLLERALAGEEAARKESEKTRKERDKARDAEAAERQAKRKARRAGYVSDMKRAEYSWAVGNVGVVRALVRRHLPEPEEEDLRDFEWYYWRRQCNRHQRLFAHGKAVDLIAVSPDGKHLATAGAVEPGRVAIRIWDLASGRLQRTLAESQWRVVAMRFVGEGPRLALVQQDNRHQVWNWQKGELLSGKSVFPRLKPPLGDPRREYALAQSGRFFAASDRTSVVLRSDARTPFGDFRGEVPGVFRTRTPSMISDIPWAGGASTSAEMSEILSRHGPKAWDPRDELAPPPEEDGGTVFALAISPDESLLAAGSRHGELLVWDVASGQERLRVTAHQDIIWDVAFSPDGQRVATASKDGRIKLWELADGKPSATLTGHTGAVRAVAFSADGLVASGGDDRTVRIWSAFSGGPVTVWVGHEQAVTDVAFTHDNAAVLSASRDGTVKQWAIRDDDHPLVIGDPMPLACLDVFPDGRRVAAAGKTSEVAIWDLGTGRVTTVLVGQRSDNAFHVRAGEEGTSVVAGTWDGTFTKWDIASGDVLAQRRLPVSALTWSMPQFDISPDGRFVAGQCDDGKVHIVELESGEEVTIESGPMAVGRVLFSPDGKQLLTIGFPLKEDGKPADAADVKLWDAGTGELSEDVVGGVVASTAGFSPDGRRLAWCPRARTEDEEPPDPEILICDLDSKQIAQRLSLPPEIPGVGSLAFSPDGTHLAATAAGKTKSQPLADRMLLVWELSSGKLVHRLPDRGWELEFTPDGSEVAVAGVDGRVRFWSVARGTNTRELARPSGPVVSAVFSPDGRKLGVGSDSPARKGLYATATQLRTIVSLDEDGKQEQKVLPWPMGSKKWSLVALADGSFVPPGSLWQRFKLDPAASARYGLSRPPLPREVYAAGANCAYVLTSNGTILRREISEEGEIAVAEKAIEDAACTAMAASSDGRWLALAADQTIQLRHGETLNLLHTLEGHEDYVRGLAFSRDGSRLASGSSDRTVRLWNTQDGALEATLLGHWQTVTHVSFSKRGGTVASSSRDGTIQLWDVRTGESKTTLVGHVGPVHWVEFSPNGNTLASAGEDGTVRLWKGAADVDGKSEP